MHIFTFPLQRSGATENMHLIYMTTTAGVERRQQFGRDTSEGWGKIRSPHCHSAGKQSGAVKLVSFLIWGEASPHALMIVFVDSCTQNLHRLKLLLKNKKFCFGFVFHKLLCYSLLRATK